MGLIVGNALRKEGSKELGKWIDPEHRQRRKQQLGKVALGTAMVVTAGASGVYAWQDGWGTGFAAEANITKELSVVGGEATLTKLDLDFKETCWTSSTVDIAGSMGKAAAKLGDWEALWRSVTADFQVENPVCIDPAAVSATRNSQTKEIVVTVDDPAALKTRTALVPGTLKYRSDGAPLNNMASILKETLNTIPIVEDSVLAKEIQQGVDEGDSQLLNIAILEGMKNSLSCTQAGWPTTYPAIEQGLRNTVLPGVLLYEPNYDPESIKVLIADKRLADVDPNLIGTQSNIDEQYNAIINAKKDHGTVVTGAGNKSECKIADSVSMVSTPTIITASAGDK